jgi:hypothetical protein
LIIFRTGYRLHGISSDFRSRATITLSIREYSPS